MARFLSVETGGEFFAAALFDGSQTRVRREARAPHSRFALPTIEALMREADLSFSDLDFFAFAAGPGRFGGLRLGCGIAQGLAYAAQKPVVAVPSLAALASPFVASARRIVAALPAYREHVYLAAFVWESESEWRTIFAPQTIPVAQPPALPFADEADEDAQSPPLAVGAGFARYPALASSLGARVAEADADGGDSPRNRISPPSPRLRGCCSRAAKPSRQSPPRRFMRATKWRWKPPSASR